VSADTASALVLFIAQQGGRPIRLLESERKNGIATRNARLGAIRVFVRFMASHHPEQLGSLQRIIGLPFKHGVQEAPIEPRSAKNGERSISR